MPTHAEHILVVDDSAATREILRRNLEGAGYVVHAAPGVAEAIALLEDERGSSVSLVITDYRMPEADGLALVRELRSRQHRARIIMLTGFATVAGAVTAMREGVHDYLPKPFSDEELRQAVASALERLPARAEDPGAPSPQGMLGASPGMRRVYRLIERAAATEVPVLIHGESGTGKELVARAIHYGGRRAGEAFLAVNCAAIPDNLIESELFGHTRGAFTGAVSARPGFFIAAQGGTLFLDEIAELAPVAQAKLLRVIQERKVHPVGADAPRDADVRLVAATNKDLAALSTSGEFRQDLYFRLNVLPIELPPLRERGDDVAMLIHHFVEAAAAEHGLPQPQITPGAMEALRRYSWPGNVRELQNLVHRLVILSEGGIDTPDLPEILLRRAPAGTAPTQLRPLREVELEHVRAVLDAVGGNKTRAAQILGIDRKSLRERLKAAEPGAD
jgi:two-component system response regulator HydG